MVGTSDRHRLLHEVREDARHDSLFDAGRSDTTNIRVHRLHWQTNRNLIHDFATEVIRKAFQGRHDRVSGTYNFDDAVPVVVNKASDLKADAWFHLDKT